MGIEDPKKPDRRKFLKAAGALGASSMLLDGDQIQEGTSGVYSGNMLENLSKSRKLPERSAESRETTLADRALNFFSKLLDIKVEGAQNLREIPPGKHIIFLTTHLSDYDVPLAIAGLAKEGVRNLKAAVLSTHTRFTQNPGGYVARRIGGPENTFVVSHDLGKGGKEKTVFNPNDFPPMKDALTAGNDLVMAAYLNLKITYREKKWQLPEKGGNGGVYLANSVPDTVIVPIAVDIESEPFGMGTNDIVAFIKNKARGTRANIRIGKPIEPMKISGIEKFPNLLTKAKSGTHLTPEERGEFTRIRKELREESNRVMQSLAEMLPREKRQGQPQLEH